MIYSTNMKTYTAHQGHNVVGPIISSVLKLVKTMTVLSCYNLFILIVVVVQYKPLTLCFHLTVQLGTNDITYIATVYCHR